MALTDNCDLYGSIGEKGLNLVGRHVMRQRPSLFNYGTAGVAANRSLWCRAIDATRDVTEFADPLMSIAPPLPVPGTSEYCVQIVAVEIDFHPGNTIAIPPELGPPLPAQHFAGGARVCAGIGCPSEMLVDRLAAAGRGPKERERPGMTIPAAELDCFCLELFVLGHVETDGARLSAALDRLEIVEITPEGLEHGLECYLETLIRLAILPQLRVAVPTLALDLLDLATVTISPVSPSAAVPNNPAIEDDELRGFLDVAVAP